MLTDPLPSSAEHVLAARTMLFVPGDRPDRFAKAAAAGADVVIIDLEDGVPPEHTRAARESAAHWLRTRPAAVRINPLGSDHADADLALVGSAPGLTALVVPKAEDPQALARLQERAAVPVIPLIETAQGLVRVQQIAEAPAVARLALGHLDLAADLHCDPGHEAMLLARSSLVLASRAAGLSGPVDGVTTQLDDPQLCAADARHARALGFTGKLLIHPAQVAPVADALTASPAEIEWAQRVLTASGAGATRVGDEMVDAPALARARSIVASATARDETRNSDRDTEL